MMCFGVLHRVHLRLINMKEEWIGDRREGEGEGGETGDGGLCKNK